VRPTPIQSWFLEQCFADAHHWNQTFLFEIPSEVDVEALQGALDHVVAHHDALRLRVVGQGFEAMLRHDPNKAAPPIRRVDLAPVAPRAHPERIEAAATVAQSELNLQQGPLLAAVHFDRGAAPSRLLAIHHLAVDGVS